MFKRLTLSTLLVGITANEAFAGPVHHAPEIDGGGALAAIAIVVSIGVIFSRWTK